MRSWNVAVGFAFVSCTVAAFAAGTYAQAPAPGPQLTSQARGGLKMLLDKARLGGSEVAMGERSYPASYASAEHTHSGLELIYVLEGEFDHIINGRAYHLKPGMLGVVKPGEKVQHKTGAVPAKTLMVWVPGADGEELAAGWRSQ